MLWISVLFLHSFHALFLSTYSQRHFSHFIHDQREVGKYFCYTTFSHTSGRTMNLCLQRSSKLWCMISRHLLRAGSSECFARSYKRRDSIGHRAIHLVLTKGIISHFKTRRLACANGTTRTLCDGSDPPLWGGPFSKARCTDEEHIQEYDASKVIRIFTEDWIPYLGLDSHNHKE